MKKLVLAAVLAAFIAGGLFAQQELKHESDYYYHTVLIEKIYVYRRGYMVVYRKGAAQMARTYLPEEWFNTMGGKGEIVGLGTGHEWPSMTVYYKNGEFSHVRLRLRRHKGHESWGVVPLHINLDEYFQDIEEVQLEF